MKRYKKCDPWKKHVKLSGDLKKLAIKSARIFASLPENSGIWMIIIVMNGEGYLLNEVHVKEITIKF